MAIDFNRQRNRRAPVTQELANAYPMWSAIRNDEQSIGGQLLNTFGNTLEDLHEQAITIGNNYNITTANIADVDLVYRMQLPGTFSFVQNGINNQEVTYRTPIVSGVIDGTWYQIPVASGNNLENFWYYTPPNRIEVANPIDVNNYILDDVGIPIYGGLISGFEYESPFIPTSGIDLQVPNRLWVEIVSGENFLDIQDNGSVQRGLVTIAGLNRQGVPDLENMVFIHNNILQTSKEWKHISKIQVADISPEANTKIRVLENRFERIHTPKLPEQKDFFNINESPESLQPIDTFWDIGTNSQDNPVLNYMTYAGQDLADRTHNFLDKKVVRSWELLDSNGNVITPVDLAVVPFSHYIWVIDNRKLYLYDTDLDIPDMNLLTKKTQAPMIQLVPETYHTTFGEPIRLECIWRRPQVDIIKHRLWATSPDGNQYTIESDSLQALDLTGSWVFVPPTSRHLRQNENLTLEEYGDWIFNLDVVYSNGLQETDQRIVSVDYKLSSASFDIDGLPETVDLKGIDIDSDNNIQLLGYNTNRSRVEKYIITPHYDVMLIDYNKKVLYFKENYEQIRVKIDE